MTRERLSYFKEYRSRPKWREYNRRYQKQWKDDRRAVALASLSCGGTLLKKTAINFNTLGAPASADGDTSEAQDMSSSAATEDDPKSSSAGLGARATFYTT